MAQPAKALEYASNGTMVGPKQAADFWAAVKDCLVQFHNVSGETAAERVTDLWKRLGNLPPPPPLEEFAGEDQRSFDEMIYHAEPWYVACNLAGEQKPLDENKRASYVQILKQNHLA